MDIRQLNYFTVIAEEKNISKAAERLFISQSALSQQLAQLENILGTTLFLRRRGALELTEAGQIYLNSVYHIIHIDKMAEEQIRRIKNQTDICIDIGISFSVLPHALKKALAQIAVYCPQVRIQLVRQSSRRLKILLSNGQLQLAILSDQLNRQDSPADGLTYYPLCEENFFMIRCLKNTKKNEVIPVPVISCMYSVLSELRQLELIRQHLKHPCRHALSLENPADIPELVRSLSGVSILPGNAVLHPEPDLRIEPLPDCRFSYVLAAQSNRQVSPYLPQIIKLIREAHSALE
ncbi:MAG: LysR family transcriptional regulator [Eubacteriales bacterium]|nr:LysR family transcriptional regulator [Eubacteriales bacterium]